MITHILERFPHIDEIIEFDVIDHHDKVNI
jgi:hypothetical protein